MSIYCKSGNGSAIQLGGAIYAESAGKPNGARLAQDTGNAVVNSTTAQWYDVPINLTFTPGQVLWLTFWGGGNGQFMYYHSPGATNQFAYGFTGTFENWQNPGNSTSALARVASIYATYTVTP